MQFNYLYIDGILDFKETQFQLNDINIFLGANNTGKSSVFRILELLQNSINIYQQDGLNLNFEGTRLASIKNINTEELITFRLPFSVLGGTTLELQYNNKGELILLELKDNDTSIIKKERASCSINLKKIIHYLDDEFSYYQTNYSSKIQDRFKFIKSNLAERQKVDRSALSLVEEKLNKDKQLLEKIWRNSLLEEETDDEINKSFELVSSTKTVLMSSLSEFLECKDYFDYNISENINRYSRSIVSIFNFLSELETLVNREKLLPYTREHQIIDNEDNFIDVVFEEFDFLGNNKDAPHFSEKFKYLLNVIRLSLEKGFLDLIELLNNISYLSAIRLNTISPYIDDSNNGTLNRLSKQFFYAKSEQKKFVNKWLEKLYLGKIQPKELQLGKMEKEEKSLVGLEIKALIFYKFKNGGVDTETAFTLNKISTGTLQIIVLLMKISLSKKGSILCIEEPEINLHPRLQTTIADILEDANKDFKIRFIVETHNEYLLSRFQNLIAEEKVNKEKLSIHYFQTFTETKPQVIYVPIQEDGSIDYSIIYDNEYYPQGYNLHLSLLNKRREKFIEIFEKAKELATNGGEIDEEAIYNVIDKYLKNQDYSSYKPQLNNELGVSDVSNELPPDIVNLLTSGLFLQNNLSNTSDFSPAVMQLGKAVENIIKSACKDIFIMNNINQSKITSIKSIYSWLFGNRTGSLKVRQNNNIKINSSDAQHLLYSLAEPSTRTVLTQSLYHNNILDINKLEINKDRFGKNDLVSAIRDLRNDAAHKSTQISLTKSTAYLDNVINFLKMWIEIKI
jgi:predicted ATPase